MIIIKQHTASTVRGECVVLTGFTLVPCEALGTGTGETVHHVLTLALVLASHSCTLIDICKKAIVYVGHGAVL